jgi:hypothetical protein
MSKVRGVKAAWYPVRDTLYGFKYVEERRATDDKLISCWATVERVASISRRPGEGSHRFIEIKTPRDTLVVRITPTGLIREHHEVPRGS